MWLFFPGQNISKMIRNIHRVLAELIQRVSFHPYVYALMIFIFNKTTREWKMTQRERGHSAAQDSNTTKTNKQFAIHSFFFQIPFPHVRETRFIGTSIVVLVYIVWKQRRREREKKTKWSRAEMNRQETCNTHTALVFQQIFTTTETSKRRKEKKEEFLEKFSLVGRLTIFN